MRFWFLGALLCLLAACGGPSLAPLAPGATVLAFGDSLTRGVGGGRNGDYPAALARMTGLDIVNAGVSGETTAQGRQRLPHLLEQYQPKLLILLQGGNDILRNLDSAATRANLAQMIELAQARGTPVVLLGVPEKSLFSDSAPFYRELAAQYGLVFDDDLVAGLLRSPGLKSDPVHLNAAGYSELAGGVHALLSAAGALP